MADDEKPPASSEPPSPEEDGIAEIEAEFGRLNQYLDRMLRLAGQRQPPPTPQPFRDPASSRPPR